jgi:hypothetical protein
MRNVSCKFWNMLSYERPKAGQYTGQSTAAIHTHRPATPRRCQADRVAKGQQPAIGRGEAPPRGAVSLHVSGSSDRCARISEKFGSSNLSQQRGVRGVEPHATGLAPLDLRSIEGAQCSICSSSGWWWLARQRFCRKGDFAGARPAYRSVYTLELNEAPYNPARILRINVSNR